MVMPLEKISRLEAQAEMWDERHGALKSEIAELKIRIQNIDTAMTTKMDKLETIIVELKENFAQKEKSTLKSLITIGLAIIASLIGTVGGLVWYVITALPA